MGFIKHCTTFVNRINDSKEIGRDILNANGNVACIVHSARGVGKSALINKLQKEYENRYDTITVKPILSQQYAGNIHGFYVQEIFSSFIEVSDGISDFYNFTRICNRETRKQIYQMMDDPEEKGKGAIFKALISLFVWLLPIIVSFFSIPALNYIIIMKIFGIGFLCLAVVQILFALFTSKRLNFKFMTLHKKENFLEQLCNTISEQAFYIQLEYIKYILNLGGKLIHLDNVELIDSKSLKGLSQCMTCGAECYPANYFLLEYTTDEGIHVEKFAESLKNNFISDENSISIKIYDLPPLNETHIKEIAKEFVDLTDEADKAISLFWTEEAKGNLLSLIHRINYLNTKSPSTTLDEEFRKMPQQRKLVLLILLFSQGIETLDFIEDIISYLNSIIPDAKSEFTALILNNFIEVRNGIVYCDSDLLSQWEILYKDYESIKNSAMSMYLRFINSKIHLLISKKNIDKYRYMDNLFNLYLNYYPERIVTWLGYIVDYAKQDYNLEYLKKVFQQLWIYYKNTSAYDDKILLKVVQNAYHLELYMEAKAFADLIQNNCAEKMAYEAMLLYRTDNYSEAICYCERHHTLSRDTRFDFLLYQIEMICHRMLYQVNECWEIMHSIYLNKKFKHYYEYGFFLRNMEIVVDVKKSLFYLRKSMLFFSIRGDKKNTSITKLSYGMQLARLGHITAAENAIKSAQRNMIKYPIVAQHYYYVDLAAVLLLKQHPTKQIQEYLEKAEFTAHTAFDELVILTNQLAYCVLTLDNSTFRRILKKIQSGNTPYITQIFRSINFNIAMMFKVSGDIENMNFYIDQSQACHNTVVSQNPNLPLNQLWEARYHNDPTLIVTKELQFMYQKPYHVSFISFWHFDIPDFL